MKPNFILIGVAVVASCTTTAIAQNLVDATRFSTTGINGTARYKSMAGAFGALGGDPTCMSDNPAGIAVYRNSSTFSFTPGIAVSRTESGGEFRGKKKRTDFTISELSYILSIKTDNCDHLVNVNLGFGYNHKENSDRKYVANFTGAPGQSQSFGSYVANVANTGLIKNGRFGTPDYLGTDAAWNDYNMPLLGLMGYNSYAIDNIRDANGMDKGGVQSYDQANGLASSSGLYVREDNRYDEYNINISANWDDFVYAGLTVGIVDFNSTINSEFSEYYDDEYNSYTYYDNDLETKGTGVNIKFGAIVKPIDNWRIGLAVHTPTWFEMKDIYDGGMATNAAEQDYNGEWINSGSVPYEYKYRFYTPWKYQFSTAYVFGTRAILSFEYDMDDYRSMRYHESDDSNGFDDFSTQKQIIKDYMTEMHTFRIGGEIRATQNLSFRAGYAHQTSPYKDDVVDEVYKYDDDPEYIYSSSTKPNYTLQGSTDYICAGLGWRGKGWYVDFSFMHKTQYEKVGAFPTTAQYEDDNYTYDVPGVEGQRTSLRTKTMNFDLTLGFRF